MEAFWESLGPSWRPLEPSLTVLEASWTLDVALALFNRLGNLVSEFLVVLGRFVVILGAREGGDFLTRLAPGSPRGRPGSAGRGMGRPLETLQNLTRQLRGILTRTTCRGHGGGYVYSYIHTYIHT